MKNQKVRSFAVIVVAAMLLATTAISMSTTQNAFAGKYGKNQATSQANACGNDFMPLNVGCQNIGSQIQGDENSVALAAQQTFPAADVTPTPGPGPEPEPEPQTCEECFAQFLVDVGISQAELEALFGITIADLCAALDAATPAEIEAFLTGTLEPFLLTAGFDAGAVTTLIDCLLRVLIG
jgi:hypothetical protein